MTPSFTDLLCSAIVVRSGPRLDCPVLPATSAASTIGHREACMRGHHIESIASHGAGGKVHAASDDRRPHTMNIIYGKVLGRSRHVAHVPKSAHALPHPLYKRAPAPAHPLTHHVYHTYFPFCRSCIKMGCHVSSVKLLSAVPLEPDVV